MARWPNTAPLAGFAGHVSRTAAGATNWLREVNYHEKEQKIVRGSPSRHLILGRTGVCLGYRWAGGGVIRSGDGGGGIDGVVKVGVEGGGVGVGNEVEGGADLGVGGAKVGEHGHCGGEDVECGEGGDGSD
eukprot:scaffold1723_cov104-Isochrysis_galbana.AAC.12